MGSTPYFAAIDVLRNEEFLSPMNRLAVWALNLESRGLFNDIQVVRVPGSTSPNLAAQQGLFTLVREDVQRGKPYHPRLITDVLEDSGLAHDYPLWRITLPHSEANKLAERCHKYGISSAILFPGYDGAAASAMERFLTWKR